MTSIDIKKASAVNEIPYKGYVPHIRYFKKGNFLDKAEAKITYPIEKNVQKSKILKKEPVSVVDTFFGMCKIVLKDHLVVTLQYITVSVFFLFFFLPNIF